MRQTQLRKHLASACLLFLYGCAALQLVRFYVRSTTSYLNMPRYLHGGERLPFQDRVFPVLILRPLTESAWVGRHLVHSNGVFTPERGAFYVLSLVSLAVAAWYTQRLYNAVTDQGLFRHAVFPVLLFTVMFTYVIHNEANFSYPYDLPSLAFFSAGLFYVYERRFLPLLAVMLVGTSNRETTLFLIALYVIDAATRDGARDFRLSFRAVAWARVMLLSSVWLGVKLLLAHHYRGNDASESFLRVRDNLHQLRPRLVPALLNICGYTLPIVVVFQRWLAPPRFRNYLWVLPLWFGIMFVSGVLVETRIYGELCSFSSVALVLILERRVAAHFGWVPEATLGDDCSRDEAVKETSLPLPTAA